MEHDSKEAIRAGARKGARKLARMKRQRRNYEVARALKGVDGFVNIAELSRLTGRTPAVVRAALAERLAEGRAEKVGTQYREIPR